MEDKKYDFFGSLVASPDANLDDFIIKGYTADNSYIQDFSVYKSDDFIRDHFKDNQGRFDEKALKKAYDNSIMLYNIMANTSYDDLILQQISYGEHDLYAPKEKRRHGPQFQEIKVSNPYRQIYGLTTVGQIEEPTMSMDEIALTNKVLKNPKTAGDNLENAIWEETPNNHFWKYIWDTLVLAQYDNDGEHKDPITGEIVLHKKGDLRMNENGEFFYEKLDGRSIYGRQVLNKGNILTVDGSKWNRYDIFDSDDLNQKNPIKSLLMNTVLVGSMFLGGGVGTWITGLTLASQLVGLAGTLGKMASSSDNPTLSAMEGWSASWDRRRAKTEYAQLHPWCWESFIDMIGDFVEIPRTLRFIFEKIPYVVKGGDFISIEKQEAHILKLMNTQLNLNKAKAIELQKNYDLVTYRRLSQELSSILVLRSMAERLLSTITKSALTIGSVFSKGYMALSIGSNMYGEAKAAGASDTDATMITLGYMAGLYGFLNAQVSQWILPELKAGGYLARTLAKALVESDEELKIAMDKLTPKLAKLNHVKKLFNIGKGLVNGTYADGSKTLSATIASGVGMGIEGMGFEFLSDLSKGCYDVVKWLQGEDHRMETFGYNFDTDEWNIRETLSLYGETFLSALAGGSIANAFETYKGMRKIGKIDNKQAASQLVYMIRNGQISDFIKSLNRMTLGNKNLSFNTEEINGELVFKPGTKTDNQDLFIKNKILNQILLWDNMLNAEGAKLPDDTLLDILTIKDLRYVKLLKSIIRDSYLDEYNTTTRNLLLTTAEYNDLLNSVADTNGDGSVTDRENRRAGRTIEEKKARLDPVAKKRADKLESDIKELRKKVKSFLNGEKSYNYIKDSMFDLNDIIKGLVTFTSFPLYVRYAYGKDYDKLSDEDKNDALEKYEKWKELDYKERLRVLSDNFYDMLINLKDVLKEHGDTYRRTEHSILLARNFIERVSELYLTSEIGENAEIGAAYNLVESMIESFGTSEELLEYVKSVLSYEKALHDKELSDELKKKVKEEFLEFKSNILKRLIENNFTKVFKDLGYAPTELKNQLTLFLKQLGSTWHEYVNKTQEKVNDTLGIDPKAINDFQDAVLFENSINEALETLLKLNESPLWKNINTFIAAINKDNPTEAITIDNIFKTALNLYNLTLPNTSRFKLTDLQHEQLLEALNILMMYKAAIEASRYDNAGVSNTFGYASTLNEVARKMDLFSKERLELAEIDSDIADKLINDINVNANKIEYLLRLHQINEGQKLSTLDRVAIKTKGIIYDRVRRAINIPDNPLSTWEGFKEFLATINSLTSLLEIYKSKTTVLDKDNKKTLEQELIKCEDAIFDFFDKNKDKLEDPKKLALFINPKIFNLYERPDDLLDDNITALSDNSIIWYFCSRAALKSSTFYSRFGRIINLDSENPLAPVFMQELAIYTNYASIMNRSMFTNFYNAYRYALREDWKGRTKEERIKILNDLGYKGNNEKFSDNKFDKYCFNFLPVPKYANIVLVEGMPGTGKSAGVLPLTLALIKAFNPELLKDIIIILGDNIENARDLAKNLGLEQATVYGINEFMETYVENPEKFSSDSLELNSFANDDYQLVPSVKVKTPENNAPKIIIVDEILRLNTAEVTAILKFAENLGISVLGSGDFELSGVTKQCDITIDGSNLKMYLQNDNFDFARVPKLGLSMRTDNVIKTRNINAIRSLFRDAKKAVLTYYSDDTGLYGDRVISYDKNDLDKVRNASWYNEFFEIIDLMVKTLPEGEKIGFIYSNPNSIFVKILLAKYKPGDDCPIDYKTQSAAAGKEASYYIIDATPSEGDVNYTNFKKDINTGISRSSRGSLLLLPAETLDIDELRSPNKIDEPKNKASIIKYASDRKNLLQELFPNTEKVLEESEKKVKTSPTGEKDKPNDKSKEEPESLILDDSTGGLDSNLNTHDHIENLIVKENLPNSKFLLVDEKGNILITAHTFNNFYTGVVIENGKIVINEELFSKRVDGANGILKLIKSDKPFEERLTIDQIEDYFIKFLDILLNTEDKSEMVIKISNIIRKMNSDFESDFDSNIKKNKFYVNFGFKLISHSSKGGSYDSGQYTAFSRDAKERTKFNNSESSIPNDKMIVAVIGTSSKGTVLEIPLMTLSSPLTIMQCDEYFKPVSDKFFEIYNSSKDKNQGISDGIKGVIETFGNDPKYTQLINLFKIFDRSKADFTYITNKNKKYGTLTADLYDLWVKSTKSDTENWFDLLKEANKKISESLDSSTWTPAKNLELIGGRIIKLRGLVLVIDEHKIDATNAWMTINDLKKRKGLYVSNKIYTVATDFTDNEGNVIAKKGNSFVLISCTSQILSDAEMWSNFINNRNRKNGVRRQVELIYVSPPKASIDEYFDNLARVYAQNSDERKINPTKRIGNSFTSYRILLSLLCGYNPSNEAIKLDPHNIETERKILTNKFGKEYAENVINIIEKLTKLEIEQDNGTDLVADLLKSELTYKGLNDTEFRTSLLNMFNYTLFHLAKNLAKLLSSPDYSDRYTSENEVLSDIKKCFPEGIYYDLAHEENPVTFDTNVIPILTNNDYEIDNGKSVLIYGKFDTYAFRGKFDKLIQNCLDSAIIIESKKGNPILTSPDSKHYERSIKTWLDIVYGKKSSKSKKEKIESPTEEESPESHPVDKSVNLFENLPIHISDDNDIIFNMKALNESFPDGIKSIELLDQNKNIINPSDLKIDEETLTYKFKVIIDGKEFDVEYDPYDEENRETLRLEDPDRCSESIELPLL